MRIISSARYNNFLKLEKNFDKIVENKINKLDEEDNIRYMRYSEFIGIEEQRLYREFKGKFDEMEEENEKLKENIISLKKKINILVKKTK